MITKSTYNVVKLKPIKGIQLTRHKVPEWNVSHVVSTIDLHDYRYFWFETIEMTKEQEDWGITFRPKIVNSSDKYFINAYIETHEDVLVNDSHLAQQMTNLGYEHIVKNIGETTDWIEYFDIENDKLIDYNGDAV